MGKKSCYICGHKKVCDLRRIVSRLVVVFLNGNAAMSDERAEKALSSAAECFADICAEWLDELGHN